MGNKTQIACASCGLGFAIFFTTGWWFIAGLVPPHPPLMGAAEVAQSFSQNTGTIRFGLLIAMISTAFILPFMAVIAVHTRRIEGDMPVLTYAQLVAGTVGVVILMTPTVLWTAAAFRPERDPALIMVLNDFAWLFLLMTFAPFVVQLGSIGLAILSDSGEPPVFARWVGYFNIWVAILFMPGGLITFFKTGPFAWNGLLAFWMALAAFITWFLVMFFVLLKVIRTPLPES